MVLGGGFAFQDGAEVSDGVGAGFVPAHAGVFQAAGDDTVAGGFDSAAADLPAVSDVGRVVHTVQIVAHVPGQLAMRLEHLRRGRCQIERLQLSQQCGTARVFHQVAPSLELFFAEGLITDVDLRELFQMFGGVPEIEDEVHVLRESGGTCKKSCARLSDRISPSLPC